MLRNIHTSCIHKLWEYVREYISITFLLSKFVHKSSFVCFIANIQAKSIDKVSYFQQTEYHSMFNTFKETKCREGPLREAVQKKSRQHSEHVPQALITPPPFLTYRWQNERRKKHFLTRNALKWTKMDVRDILTFLEICFSKTFFWSCFVIFKFFLNSII